MEPGVFGTVMAGRKRRSGTWLTHPPSSCPGLTRASTSSFARQAKTWMAGSSRYALRPAMTKWLPVNPCAATYAATTGGRLALASKPRGEVAEWLKAPHSKCGVPARVSGVRIPPSPPSCFALPHAIPFARDVRRIDECKQLAYIPS